MGDQKWGGWINGRWYRDFHARVKAGEEKPVVETPVEAKSALKTEVKPVVKPKS